MSTSLRAYREDDEHVSIRVRIGAFTKTVKLTNAQWVEFTSFSEEIRIEDSSSKLLEKKFEYRTDLFKLENKNVRKFFLDSFAEIIDDDYLMVKSSLRIKTDDLSGIVIGTITGVKK